MREHYQKAVERLTAHFRENPQFPALIVGGSIAKGVERDNSDIDIVLVATDEEYARRKPRRNLHYYTTDFCDYPSGYVEAKSVDLGFLREVADCGSDPARAAFEGAQIGYSRIPELEDILRRIPVSMSECANERMCHLQACHSQRGAL